MTEYDHEVPCCKCNEPVLRTKGQTYFSRLSADGGWKAHGIPVGDLWEIGVDSYCGDGWHQLTLAVVLAGQNCSEPNMTPTALRPTDKI